MPTTFFGWIIFLIGWLFVVVGSVGVALPVLPHTPFFIIALACFAKSSPKFYTILLKTPIIGPPLVQWKKDGSISRSVKMQSILTMVISFVIVLYTHNNSLIIGLIATCMLLVSTYILSRPSK